jgi:GT2 family glycosyltransferase
MLAIITVVYRNYEILHDFIESLSRQSSQFYKVYFVDLTEDEKRNIIPWVRKIEGKCIFVVSQNLGYAHGVNVGVRTALKDGLTRFAVVNPDIIFEENFVLNATQSISRNPKTIIGGKILYAKGFEYHKDRYQVSDVGHIIWYAGGYINWAHSTAHHIGVDQVDSPEFSKQSPTEFVSGCMMLYDKSVHDVVGQWDEKYFMYYEDADYCLRAKSRNINILHDPNILIYHKNAQSTGGSGSKMHELWMKRSRFRFGMKYAPLRTKVHLLINNALLK